MGLLSAKNREELSKAIEAWRGAEGDKRRLIKHNDRANTPARAKSRLPPSPRRMGR
jgi:hypothetical protein